MRTILLLIVCCFFSISAHCAELDSCRIYISAIDTIALHSGYDVCNYVISDTIYDLDRWIAIKYLSDYPDIKSAIERKLHNKKYLASPPKHSEILHSLSQCGCESIQKNIVFFSQIEDNLLVAECFKLAYRAKENMTYDKMALFTTSNYYVFIVEEDEIKKSILIQMVYN